MYLIRISTQTLIPLLFIPSFLAQNSVELLCLHNSIESVQFHQAYNEGTEIFYSLQAISESTTADLYVVEDRSAEQWTDNISLEDLRDEGAQQITLGSTLEGNTGLVTGLSQLELWTNGRPGLAFDIVLDINQNGELDDGDFIDGEQGAGAFLLPDFSSSGPHIVEESEFSVGFWHTMKIFFPQDIHEMEKQPLVVISHGWTHEYWYYDYLGSYLASHGYIVISHRNNVGAGGASATETASTTTLENIQVFLENVDLIDWSLSGRVDAENIVMTGHSTGGECVVRAYKRLYENEFVSEYFDMQSIKLVSSIAPVAFLSGNETHPENVNYHQFIAAADTDASGSPIDQYVVPLSIYERGYGNKQVTFIHGAGHEDLHGEVVDNIFGNGPNLIGKEATHSIVKPYMLALCDLYTRNNLAMGEYFKRNRNVFRPLGISDSLTISGEFKPANNFSTVLDDFQTGEGLSVSSSGASVSHDVSDIFEVLMQDFDGTYSWQGDWANGMCRSRFTDEPKCLALGWDDYASWCINMNNGDIDWSSSTHLSFRSCRITRHPLNLDHEKTDFSVELTDVMGASATLLLENYGSMLPPYPRNDGGYLNLCLPSGEYSIAVGGSLWEEEMFFTIPGYFDMQPAGSYEFVIPDDGEPCTDIEVMMFDSWGDGWDYGNLKIFNSSGDLIASGTLSNGTTWDSGEGWQNEFYIYRLPLADFKWQNPALDLTSIQNACMLFGQEYGTPSGAVAIDDVMLTGTQWGPALDIIETNSRNSLLVMPNPASTIIKIYSKTDDLMNLDIYSADGKKVYQINKGINQTPQIIDVSTWPRGLYFASGLSADGIFTQKFIVK